MTVNEMYALAIIRHTDFENPDDIEAFVDAVQVLFPDRERDTILSTPVEELVEQLKTRAEQLAADLNEMNLRSGGKDAVSRAMKILGAD